MIAAVLAWCLLVSVLVEPAWPQDQPPPPPPIPVPEISARSEEIVASLKALDERLAVSAELANIEARLPAMTGRIQRQLIETQRLLDSEPPLAVLANLADAWRGIATDIAAWSDLLTREAIVVEGELDRLNRLADQWARTREEARRSQAPSTVLQRIDITTTAIGLSRNTALSRRASILSLQARVAQQLALVQDAQARVARARGLDLAMLFRRDSPPVWRDADRGPVPWREVPTKLWAGLVSEGRLLAQFMADRPERAIIHALLFVALLIFLRMGHRRARHWSEDDPDLAMLFRRDSPPVWRDADRGPVPWREVPTKLWAPGLEQRIFVVEMLVAVAVIMIERGLVRRNEAAASSVASSSRVVVPPPLLWIALAALLLALGLGAGGYMPIARLIGDGVLRSGYAAMLLYAAVRVADGLLAWALRSWPLIGLQMVRRHRALLERRVLRLLRWVAMFLWIALTLDALSLLDSVREILSVGLAASVTRGTITISLGDVLAFVVTVALAFLASRFVRFVLEEDIYPRLLLARGLPYALSVLIHYAILLLGFLLAVAALGVDMNRVTFLTGAFGVGVGFGLQSVVNNFVSGIILLLERPVQVGDVIQLGDLEGIVRRIGIRSTTVRTWPGAEVIVPNASLISDRVTNWTLSDRRRRIDLPVGVAYGADPERVLDLLRVTALAVPGVIPEPAPLALFKDFGDSALDFEIRAWTDRFEDWLIVKSRLGVAVNAAFKNAGIVIPSPQREVTIRFPPREET